MGMTIFEESGVFDPSQYKLNIGDLIQVIAVGGGGGGYVLGHMERGNGGNGGTITVKLNFSNYNVEYYPPMNGSITGGGGAGTVNIYHPQNTYAVLTGGIGKGGSLAGGAQGQDGGPGHGVVIVTW